MKNPFGIKARKCRKKDYLFVYGLTKNLLFQYIPKYAKIKKEEFDEDFNKRYKEMVVLEKHGKRMGFYHISPDIYEKGTGYLSKIFIAPGHHNKGMGSFLMRYFEKAVYKKIRLQVWRSNPAFRFYIKMGYKIVSSKGSKYLMEKSLK